jgi:hypothetical protein
MTETRPIKLGGRTFDVPALPLRINKTAYPLCRKLSAGGPDGRLSELTKSLDYSEEEMADLMELAFLAVTAADPTVDRAAFEELPVTPPELLDAFFVIRYQTGGWVPVTTAEGDDGAGEAKGATKPPK